VKPVLIIADLHYHKPWFDWLLREAPRFEAVLIAGDLLDMFKAELRIVQAREVQSWLKRLSEITEVAVCSGNHDSAGHQVTLDRASVYQWLVELGQVPNIITDGCTRLLDETIITTVP
jgi:predicted MPP superfamily phosphohydrolase